MWLNFDSDGTFIASLGAGLIAISLLTYSFVASEYLEERRHLESVEIQPSILQTLGTTEKNYSENRISKVDENEDQWGKIAYYGFLTGLAVLGLGMIEMMREKKKRSMPPRIEIITKVDIHTKHLEIK